MSRAIDSRRARRKLARGHRAARQAMADAAATALEASAAREQSALLGSMNLGFSLGQDARGDAQGAAFVLRVPAGLRHFGHLPDARGLLLVHRPGFLRHHLVLARHYPELLAVAVRRHPVVPAAHAAVYHDAAVCGGAETRHGGAALHLPVARQRDPRRQVSRLDADLPDDARADAGVSGLHLLASRLPAVPLVRRIPGPVSHRKLVYRVRAVHFVAVREPGDRRNRHYRAAADVLDSQLERSGALRAARWTSFGRCRCSTSSTDSPRA